MTHSADLGLAVVELACWQRLRLDDDCRPIAARVDAGAEAAAGVKAAGDDPRALVDEQEAARFAAQLRAARIDEPVGGVYLTRAGEHLEVLITRRCSGGYDVYWREIDDRGRDFERLATFYRHFLTTPIPICITDPDGTILDVNRAFLDFYGYQRDEVISQNPRLLKSGRQPPDAYAAMWAQITDPAIGFWTGELINRRRDGDEVTVMLTVSAVRRDDGDAAGSGESRIVGYVATAIDITERKLLETQLSGANRELEELSRLKSEVMAITSHDLKSPLSAIIIRADLLRDELDSMTPEAVKKHLEAIVTAGHRLTKFIDDLLDVDRIESGSYELTWRRTQIDKLAQLSVDLNMPVATQCGITMTFHTVGRPRAVAADGPKLEQVFNNLIGNALKFSPEGGVVEVTYRELANGREIVVADRGPGVPEEDLENIFDRYYQARKGGCVPQRAFGVGLGLAIVRYVTELHGGRVKAENRPGGGAAFTVWLPDPPRGLAGGAAALIVDPERRVFRPFAEALVGRGIPHYFAHTAFEVRRVLDNEHPDYIFAAAEALDEEMTADLTTFAAVRGERSLLVAVGGQEPPPQPFTRRLPEDASPTAVGEVLDILLPACGLAGSGAA